MSSARPHVRIRPFSREDVADFVDLAADPRVTRYVGDGSPWDTARALDRSRAAFQDGNRWYSIVVEEDHWAGIVIVEQSDGVDAEFGIWLHPDHWGGGIARRAGGLALESFSGTHPAATVLAHVAPDNIASRALMAALGFVQRAEVTSRYGTPVGRFELQPKT